MKGSKYDQAGECQDVMCLRCCEPTPNESNGRPRLYCSSACRQAAYRARQRGE